MSKDISKRLLDDLEVGRVRSLLSYMRDVGEIPHTAPFDGDRDAEIDPLALEDIRETFDGLLHVNHHLRMALRLLEVVHGRFQLLPDQSYRSVRGQLNEVVRELLRELPDSLCVQCRSDPELRADCPSCDGKGYYSLGDLELY